MSQFNEYAKKVDDIARAAFAEYMEAEKQFEKAREDKENNPEIRGDWKAMESYVKAMQAYDEEKERFNKAKAALLSHGEEVEAIRNELSGAVALAYAVDSSKVDLATLELLKSNIMKPLDYEKLMNEAENSGNTTMIRLISDYAGRAASETAKRNGGDLDPDATRLRQVSYKAAEHNGSEYIDSFNALSDVFNRCTNNPAMISKWDSLTRELIADF